MKIMITKTKEMLKQTEIGMIPEDWNINKLCDLINHKKGFAFKSDWYKSEGNNIIKVSDFTDRSVIVDNCVCIDSNLAKNYLEYKLYKDDIVIATVGSWPNNPNSIVGRVIKIPICAEGSLLNQNAVIIRSKNKDSQLFLFYRLKLKDFSEYLISGAQGSANQASITLNDIFSFKINCPPLPEQQTIAKILSDLDSKIELNQQMNKTLEEIGKTLFKRWFVDFEFPNEQRKPYKLSGGEMVYKEELKKEIPKVSKIIYLKDQLVFERGIEPGSATYENEDSNNNLRFIRVSDLNNDVSSTFIPIELGTKTCDLENVLLSLDASVGIVKIGYSGAYSTGIRKVYDKQKKWSNGFIYFLLQSEEIQNTINQYAAGTTILHAGKSIEFMNLVIPNENTVKKLNIIVDSVYSQILNNIIENKKLAEIRDLLLPKLMSGEIRVKY